MLTIADSYIFQIMLKSTTLLGISAGMLGAVISMQRRSIEINTISASSFIGVLFSFIVSESVISSLFPAMSKAHFTAIGAALFSVLALVSLYVFYKNKKINKYIIQSLFTSILIGIGISLFTFLRESGGAIDSEVEIYLFGKSTSLVTEEFEMLSYGVGFTVIFLLLFYRRLRVVLFNEELAKVGRFYTWFYNIAINFMLIAITISAIKIMGIFLTVSIFLIPALSARLWSNRFFTIMIISGIIGLISGGAGGFIAINDSQITSGVAITLVASLIFLISLLIGPYRGLFGKIRKGKL